MSRVEEFPNDSTVKHHPLMKGADRLCSPDISYDSKGNYN